MGDPFALFDKLFAKPAPAKDQPMVGVDNHQVERMEERREAAQAAGSQLRARPRARGRPVTGKIVRGHMENPGA